MSVATQTYRGIVCDHRKAARPLRRYWGARPGGLRHGVGRPKDPMFAAEAFGSRVGLDASDEQLTALFLDHLQQQILAVFRPVLADSLFELITLGTSLHAYRLVRVAVDYEADDLPASTPVTGYNSPSDDTQPRLRLLFAGDIFRILDLIDVVRKNSGNPSITSSGW